MSTIRHGAIDYTVVLLEDCRDIAVGIGDAGKKWHSHVLSPGCIHNPFPASYAIVVEDDSDHVTYVASSDVFPEVDKELVKLLHGNDILDPAKTAAGRAMARPASALLDHVLGLEARGAAWHHHMHFPDCVLSPRRGKWTIAVESDEGLVSESYDAEPVDVLREIEVIYFRNLG